MRKQIVVTVFLKRGNKLVSCWNKFLKSWPQHIYVMREVPSKNPPKRKNIIFDTTLLLLYYIITIAVLLMHYNGKQYIGYWQQWLDKLITCKTWTVSTVLCTRFMCTVSVKESLNDWTYWSYAQRQMTPICTYSESKLTEQDKKQCKENRASE